MAEVLPIRPAREIVVWHDHEGWNVRMGSDHQVFWKRHLASGYIDLLLSKHVAFVTVEGEVPNA